MGCRGSEFLSSNAQDFIEDGSLRHIAVVAGQFLSSNAQDFIEDRDNDAGETVRDPIPEQ